MLFFAPSVEILRAVPEFSALQPHVLSDVFAEISMRVLHDQDTLIRQNDLGAALCVVVSGVLGVTWIDEAGCERVLPDILPGGMVGEVSVLSDAPALATVRTPTDTLQAFLKRKFPLNPSTPVVR